jgi:hypothetical protein
MSKRLLEHLGSLQWVPRGLDPIGHIFREFVGGHAGVD